MGDFLAEIRAHVSGCQERIYLVQGYGDVDSRGLLEDFRSVLLKVKIAVGSSDFLLHVKYGPGCNEVERQGVFLQFFAQPGHPSRLVSLDLPEAKFAGLIARARADSDQCIAASDEFAGNPGILVFSPYELDRILTAVAIYSNLLSLDNTHFGCRSLLLKNLSSNDDFLELYSDFATDPKAACLANSASLIKASLPRASNTDDGDGYLEITRVYGNVSLIDVFKGSIRGMVSASFLTNPKVSFRLFMRIEIRELLARLCTILIDGEETVALDVRGYSCLN